MKTNFRKVFYLVSETAEELSVIDALKYFKASPDEPSADRIPLHHKHVEMALQKFGTKQDEEIKIQGSTQDDPSSRGSQVNTALNLLSRFMVEIDDSDLYEKVRQLKSLAERGVITYISKRLQRIHKNLQSSGKSRMTRNEAMDEIIGMAQKYSSYYTAEESMLHQQETEAEIILSESFK